MQRAWRVRPVLPLVKIAAAAGLLAIAFGLGTEPAQPIIAAVVAAGLATWAVRDVVAPVRLAADPDGITVVVGFAGRRRLSWDQIERIRVDQRTRRGLRSELLEIDTDAALHLFSANDLGAPPEEVADALNALRAG